MNSFVKRRIRKYILILGCAALLFFFVLSLISTVAEAVQTEALSLVGSDEVQAMIAEQEETNTAGKATYVGVDDTDTAFSKKIIQQTRRWSSVYNPVNYGYNGYCEAWVGDVFRAAGYSYGYYCCAYRHSLKATKSGKVPKGAAVFSGKKRDGTMYENGHRASAFCDVCRHWAGHVAIYIGDGLVVGSQYPYMMSLDAWIDVYGYGGYIAG